MLKEFVKDARAYSIETMKSIGIERAESIFNKYHDQLPPKYPDTVPISNPESEETRITKLTPCTSIQERQESHFFQ